MYTSPFPHIEIPSAPLSRHVLRHAETLADRPALIDGTSGLTLTYGELLDAVRRFAGGLHAAGIGRGWRSVDFEVGGTRAQ